VDMNRKKDRDCEERKEGVVYKREIVLGNNKDHYIYISIYIYIYIYIYTTTE